MDRSQPPVTFAEFDLQVLLPPRWNQLSPAARAGSSLPPPLTQASEQQKSIFRLGVLFGEIHISPSVLVLISSAVFQNDGVGRPTDRSPGISLGLLGSPLGDCLLTGRPNRDANYVSAYTAN